MYCSLTPFSLNLDWAQRGNILNRLTAFVGIAETQNKINYWTNTSVPPVSMKSDFFEWEGEDEEYTPEKEPDHKVEPGTLHKNLISLTDICGLVTDLDDFKKILVKHRIKIAFDHFDYFIAETDLQLECTLTIAALHIMKTLCRQYQIEWRLWERKVMIHFNKLSISKKEITQIKRRFEMTLIV